MSNVHDHLWIDIFQHTRFPEQNEKRIWKYRHHLLFDACCDRDTIRAVNAIIASGANVNARNNLGQTPLWIASQCGQVELAKTLIVAGADVNARTNHGQTPLWIACCYNSVRIVNTLIAAGADVNARTNNGQTQLWIASFWGHVNIVEMLIAAGANVNIPSNDGQTPFSVSGNNRVRQLLLDSGCY